MEKTFFFGLKYQTYHICDKRYQNYGKMTVYCSSIGSVEKLINCSRDLKKKMTYPVSLHRTVIITKIEKREFCSKYK